MDAKTLEAMKASIEKWKRNAVAEDPEDYLVGPDDCPLCILFFYSDQQCVGCPVFDATGNRGCIGTPYDAAVSNVEDWELDENERDAAHEAARAEVAFLESLLPEGERP